MAEVFRGRIGVIGAGALGAFYGARLAHAGHDVHFLMRSDFDTVRAQGLQVKSYEGDFTLRPNIYQSADELGICDLLIVGLKTTDNDALPELLKATAGPHTLVLTMQNGLGNEELIAKLLGGSGSARVLGAIAFICSNRIAPGVIHHMDHGWLRMGELSGPATSRTHSIAALFQSAEIRCQVYDSLPRARWEKLVWNVPFNGLGVAAHATVAQVLASPQLRKTARQLMDEIIQAARAIGIHIDSDMADKMMRNSETMGEYRTSMQIDFEAGRPLEVESIIGEPLRRARGAGVQTPALQRLYDDISKLTR